jgi:hypothetical protein
MEKSNQLLLQVYSLSDKGNGRVMANACTDKFKKEMTVKQS